MPPQSPRGHILWILANSGGKMERSRLRSYVGMRLADLNPILGELANEGRIRIFGETVSLSIINIVKRRRRTHAQQAAGHPRRSKELSPGVFARLVKVSPILNTATFEVIAPDFLAENVKAHCARGRRYVIFGGWTSSGIYILPKKKPIPVSHPLSGSYGGTEYQ